MVTPLYKGPTFFAATILLLSVKYCHFLAMIKAIGVIFCYEWVFFTVIGYWLSLEIDEVLTNF